MKTLLKPFEYYPSLQEDIVTTLFFMEFYRIDFYADPKTHVLSIIEVNTSPGALPEHAFIDSFLSGIVDTTPPAGMHRANAKGVLEAFDRYLKRVGRKNAKYFGLIIREEGSFASLPDARMHADELRKHTSYEPVFCTLDQGTVLDLFQDEPQPISSISDLDILYVNPGSSLKNRDAFTHWLKLQKITLLPPRSNLLFTNKSFLTTLGRTVDSLQTLDERERKVLKDALIPSFALADLEQHLDLMRSWEGVVVKRDLGSSGINVHVYRHAQMPPEDILEHVRALKKEGDLQQETWTVQAYREPSSVLIDGKPSFFEIMVYTVMTPTPSVLFATRTFQGDKANTHFGAHYGNLCRLS